MAISQAAQRRLVGDDVDVVSYAPGGVTLLRRIDVAVWTNAKHRD